NPPHPPSRRRGRPALDLEACDVVHSGSGNLPQAALRYAGTRHEATDPLLGVEIHGAPTQSIAKLTQRGPKPMPARKRHGGPDPNGLAQLAKKGERILDVIEHAHHDRIIEWAWWYDVGKVTLDQADPVLC